MFSAFLPAFAGPAAESPSTIINSESGPWTLQSASFSGIPVEPILAARLFVSSSCFELTLLIMALAIFSLSRLMCFLGPAPLNQSVKPCLTMS